MSGVDRRTASVGLVLGLWSVLVWGGQFVIVKDMYAHVGPIQVNAIRYVFIALILVALLARVEGWASLRPGPALGAIWVLGVGVVAFNLLNYVGLRYTRPENASLIAALTPLMAVLLLWGRSRTRPSTPTFAFVFAALVGVVLVISRGHPGAYLDEGAHWGDFLCLTGALAFAAYTIGAGRAASMSPLRLTALSSVTAVVMMIGIAIVAAAVDYDPVPSGHDLLAAWPSLLYITLPGAVIAMLAWNRSARLIGGENTALLMNLVPVTVFVIQIIRGYRPELLEIVGASIAIAAVSGNNLHLRRRRTRVPPPSALPAGS
jgi:drug/metabolite transporter (DMT)-like permease